MIFCFTAAAAAGFCLVLCDRAIERKAAPHVTDDLSALPPCEAAMVLGTAQYLASGRINLYFRYRIEAAAELYNSGKVKYIIVSGDNSVRHYNEPLAMKNELVKAGVPAENIYLDYAGFRTLDSVVRMREIFSQDEYICVSQPFHNLRAVYIGLNKGHRVWGYNAQDVSRRAGLKTQIREKFARVKVFADILTHKKPKFLGEKIFPGIDEPNDLPCPTNSGK